MITINIKESNKCNGDYSLYVSFPYNDNIVQTIKSLPSRYWDNINKIWEVPINKLEYLTTALSEFDFEIFGLSHLFEEKEKIELPDFNFKTNPFNHQIEGFRYGIEHNKWLLADEQGLGKTKQVIDIAIAKKQMYGYKHCLIVCGVNGLKWNWRNEVSIHSDETAHILGQTYKKGKIVIGSTKDKIADLDMLLDNAEALSDYFIITNVESMRDESIASKLSQLCKNKTISIVAIDEIHKCKNPSSQQTKGMLKLDAECKIAMTGTPLMNTPLDLYVVMKWLDYEKHSFYQFRNFHCTFGGFGGHEITGYKNLNELQEQLNTFMLRRLKSDVLDLPEKLYIDEFVEMTPKQKQIYNEVSADIKMHIDEIAVSSNPLAQLIRLRQATGYTGILSSDVRESAKLDRLEELVDEIVANKKKVIIFSNWTQMTDAIYDRLAKGKYGVSVITGETADNERQTVVDLFQNSKNCNVLIGTIGAMGTGLTLTAATSVIFVDEPWTMANKQQAIDRCHRIGTTENITVYTIQCKDTIDERIHELVEKKGAMSDALIDGKISGNRAELLNYLLS